MTNEETIGQLKFMLEQMPKEPPSECDYIEEWLDTDRKIRSAFKTAIKIVEQEPCEDAVSRQEVAEVLLKYAHSTEGKAFAEFLVSQINDLPPVTPQPKKGHWIVEVWTNREHHTCSVCQMVVNYEPCYHYCPYCGAEMESEE